MHFYTQLLFNKLLYINFYINSISSISCFMFKSFQSWSTWLTQSLCVGFVSCAMKNLCNRESFFCFNICCKYSNLLICMTYRMGTIPSSRYSRSLGTELEHSMSSFIHILSTCSSLSSSTCVIPYHTSELERILDKMYEIRNIFAIMKW